MSMDQFLYARALEARVGGAETQAKAIAKMDEVAKAMSNHHQAMADLVESLRADLDFTDEALIDTINAENGKGVTVATGTYAIPAEYLAITGFFPVGDERLTDLPEFVTVIVYGGKDGYEAYLHVKIVAPFRCDLGGYHFPRKDGSVNPAKSAAVKAEQVILGLVSCHPRVSKISDDVVATAKRVEIGETTKQNILTALSR